MKLFIVAALIAVAAAGRLEGLERSYLPPDNGQGSSGGFHSSGNGFGSQQGFQSSGSGGFGSNSFPRSNGFGSSQGLSGFSSGGFGAATSNQYLPPNHGPSGFSSSGFGNLGKSTQRHGSNFASNSGFGSSNSGFSSGFGSSSNFGSNSGFGARGSQSNAQFSAAASRQYLTPKATSSFQNPPQQAFDEQSGYQY